jgi:hypothetical protein
MDRVYKALIEVIDDSNKERIEYLKKHNRFIKTNIKAFRPIRVDING